MVTALFDKLPLERLEIIAGILFQARSNLRVLSIPKLFRESAQRLLLITLFQFSPDTQARQ
jgi:hypothetical protein